MSRAQHNPHRLASLFTLFAGLIQAGVGTALMIGAAFVVIGGWSIGLLFLPGTLLVLLPALSCRRQWLNAAKTHV